MKLYYECSDGTVFDLMDGDISCETPETLIKRKWNYQTLTAVNGFTKLKKVYKSAEEYNLTISILCDSKSEFNALLEKLSLCFEKDLALLSPGRIYWNDWYKEVFCIVSEPSEFEEYLECIDLKLTVLSPYDYWIQENTVDYSSKNTIDFELNSDYPLEFEDFEFMPTDYVDTVDTKSSLDSNFELIFFGPCSNPYLIVGKNDYRLKNCKLADGEYLVINSKNRTIIKFFKTGEYEKALHLRNDNNIFNKIPAGKSIITKSADTQIRLKTFIERGEPIWI